MSSSQNAKETVVITGGGGYIGHRLGCTFYGKGVNVILFDIRKPVQEVPEGIHCVQGVVCSLSQLEDVVTGASCVFHTASYGMSVREQLHRQKIEDINVKGTENIIQDCLNKNVKRLVYTSSLRAAGIYGPIEQRHLPRVISALEKGLFLFVYGDNPLVQFVHVDNLISAHILAAEELTSEKKYINAGQPYFISVLPSE